MHFRTKLTCSGFGKNTTMTSLSKQSVGLCLISVIQVIYNLVFGMYVSHVFSKTLTLISAMVLHVYANFMGYPEYFEIFKGGQSSDDRVRSNYRLYHLETTIFYIFGAVGCLSCCLVL